MLLLSPRLHYMLPYRLGLLVRRVLYNDIFSYSTPPHYYADTSYNTTSHAAHILSAVTSLYIFMYPPYFMIKCCLIQIKLPVADLSCSHFKHNESYKLQVYYLFIKKMVTFVWGASLLIEASNIKQYNGECQVSNRSGY